MKTKEDGIVDMNQDQKIEEFMIEISGIVLPQMPAIIKSILAISESVKENKFIDLLKGIALSFENIESKIIKKNKIDKFLQIIKNQEKNEVLSNLLDIVFISKNTNCRLILGIITGRYLLYNNLDYVDTTIMNALKDVFDDDLLKFFLLTNDAEKLMKDKQGDSTFFIYNYEERERIILDKLQNLNLLGRDLAGNRLTGETPILRYQKTIISDRLMQYILYLKNKHIWVFE